jgi:hypothetical protein
VRWDRLGTKYWESMASGLSNGGNLRYASDLAAGGGSGRDQRVMLWPALRTLIEPYHPKPAIAAHQSVEWMLRIYFPPQCETEGEPPFRVGVLDMPRIGNRLASATEMVTVLFSRNCRHCRS